MTNTEWAALVEDNLREKTLSQEHTALRADPARWRGALIEKLDEMNTQFTIRAAEIGMKRSECLALGEKGKATFFEAMAAYQTWKGGAVYRKKKIEQRLREVKSLLRADNVEKYTEERHDYNVALLRARVAECQRALGHAYEALRELYKGISGHSGDEESGQCDTDCEKCICEAAIAHVEHVLYLKPEKQENP